MHSEASRASKHDRGLCITTVFGRPVLCVYNGLLLEPNPTFLSSPSYLRVSDSMRPCPPPLIRAWPVPGPQWEFSAPQLLRVSMASSQPRTMGWDEALPRASAPLDSSSGERPPSGACIPRSDGKLAHGSARTFLPTINTTPCPDDIITCYTLTCCICYSQSVLPEIRPLFSSCRLQK